MDTQLGFSDDFGLLTTILGRCASYPGRDISKMRVSYIDGVPLNDLKSHVRAWLHVRITETQTMFFANHSSQSCLLLLLPIPFSTMPCRIVSDNTSLSSMHTYIEQYCRRYMNTLQAVVLYERLQVVGDTIADIQATVLAWLRGDFEL